MFTKQDTQNILKITQTAGQIILKYYNDHKNLQITTKSDDSPVTQADLMANAFINIQLQQKFPEIAIVSEENDEKDNLKAAQNSKYFLVDPLDGTSAFIKKSDEFTVNIALIEDATPTFGAIYLPARDLMYFTQENHSFMIKNYSKNSDIDTNSQKIAPASPYDDDFLDNPSKIDNSQRYHLKKIKVSNKKDNITVICTKREPEKSQIASDLMSRGLRIKETLTIASSYKFCLIAQGKADLYPRKAHIKAWDVAAGHAIVKYAGGHMVDANKHEIKYHFTENFTIPFFEVY